MSPHPPSSSSPLPPPSDAVAVQARAWIAWLASGATDAGQMRAFEQWLGEPGHRHAFEHERQLWRSLGPRPPAPAAPVPRRRRARWHAWSVATAALLVLAWVAPDAWLRLQADHRSTRAIERVSLPDGSRAVLDADSAIAVHYDGHVRRIALLRGQAWFEVAHEPSRPFQVEAQGGVVEDISTAFAVSRWKDEVEAVVEQGRVRVAATDRGGWTYLEAGQRARFAPAGRVTRLDDVALDRIAAWRDGELLLEAASVEEAVQRIARYRSGATFVRGDLSALPAVNAALRIDRPEQALDALAVSAGLSVTRLPMGVAIVAPAQ
ncbi:FecR domain-containing protein [Stenotrophomonas sp. TWI587]|uniref:FecR family protein n=1 Tax=Stenotrophomonas sp. TWI587 TaxID=3136783 RepID=UPI00320AF2F4